MAAGISQLLFFNLNVGAGFGPVFDLKWQQSNLFCDNYRNSKVIKYIQLRMNIAWWINYIRLVKNCY